MMDEISRALRLDADLEDPMSSDEDVALARTIRSLTRSVGVPARRDVVLAAARQRSRVGEHLRRTVVVAASFAMLGGGSLVMVAQDAPEGSFLRPVRDAGAAVRDVFGAAVGRAEPWPDREVEHAGPSIAPQAHGPDLPPVVGRQGTKGAEVRSDRSKGQQGQRMREDRSKGQQGQRMSQERSKGQRGQEMSAGRPEGGNETSRLRSKGRRGEAISSERSKGRQGAAASGKPQGNGPGKHGKARTNSKSRGNPRK